MTDGPTKGQTDERTEGRTDSYLLPLCIPKFLHLSVQIKPYLINLETFFDSLWIGFFDAWTMSLSFFCFHQSWILDYHSSRCLEPLSMSIQCLRPLSFGFISQASFTRLESVSHFVDLEPRNFVFDLRSFVLLRYNCCSSIDSSLFLPV